MKSRSTYYKVYIALMAALAVVVATGLWWLAIRDPSSWYTRAAETTVAVLSMVFGETAVGWSSAVEDILPYGVAWVGYGVLTGLVGGALALAGRRHAWPVGAAAALAVGMGDMVCRLVIRKAFSTALGLWSLAGILVASLCVWLWKVAARRFPRLFNRETVSYVVFGALTTVVNIVVYDQLFHRWELPNLISNALAWVAAVLFAYVVNKWFVFRSRGVGARRAWREFAAFVGARIVSLLFDEGCMFLLVDCLRWDANLSKLLANVIVMILNYFFSKWFIFKREEPTGD